MDRSLVAEGAGAMVLSKPNRKREKDAVLNCHVFTGPYPL